MKEIKDIVAAYDKAREMGLKTALATVVHVQGSSYRRPGARMLVTEEGQLTGAISGGCLEGDALRKARNVMVQQKSRIVTYDTTDEDDATLGVGLGCNGIIHILIEPIAIAEENNPITLLRSFLQSRQKGVLVTLFSLQNKQADHPGTTLLRLPNKITKNREISFSWKLQLMEDVEQVWLQELSGIRSYALPEGEVTAFVEYLNPPIALVIVGAGNDAFPLVQMSQVLGWETTVVDGRSNYATSQRFPLAQRVLVTKPESLPEQISFDNRTALILMTHNYKYEQRVLRAVQNKPVAYIGVLGPKKKLDRMLEELRDEGLYDTPQEQMNLYGPVGLDLGAETSEEIALSIVAEVQKVFAGKSGNSLREKQDAIHPRVQETTKTVLPEKDTLLK